jgi:hypothetical protein
VGYQRDGFGGQSAPEWTAFSAPHSGTVIRFYQISGESMDRQPRIHNGLHQRWLSGLSVDLNATTGGIKHSYAIVIIDSYGTWMRK